MRAWAYVAETRYCYTLLPTVDAICNSGRLLESKNLCNRTCK